MGWLTRVCGLRPAGCNVRQAACGVGREGRTDGRMDARTEGRREGCMDGRELGRVGRRECTFWLPCYSGCSISGVPHDGGFHRAARSPHCGLAMQLLAVIVRIADSPTQCNLLHAVIMATPMSHPSCLVSSQLIRPGSLHCRGPDPEGQMPAETFNAREVVTSFARKGFR